MKRRMQDMNLRKSFLTELKLELGARVPQLALCLLAFSLYHVLALFLALNSAGGRGFTGLEQTDLIAERLLRSSVFFGLRSPAVFLSGFFAVFLSMQGFSYLNSRKKLDFYEALPISRRRRFFGILLSGLLIYLLSYFGTKLIGFLIALAFHALNRTVLIEALQQSIRELVLFLALSGVALLARMLSGNTLISVFLLFFFLVYEFFVRALQLGFRFAFYRTMVPEGYPIWIRTPRSSPFFYYSNAAAGFPYLSSETVPASEMLRFLQKSLLPDLFGVLLFLFYLMLSYLAYRRRRAEDAGKALVFPPIYLLLKFLIAVPLALSAGGLAYAIRGGGLEFPMELFMLFLISLLSCCILEIVYHLRFRSLFSRPWDIFLVFLLSGLCFFWYRFDLGGFDRYVPKKETVESASLYLSDNFGSRVDEYGDTDYGNDSFKRMKLKDIDAVRELARQGQKYTRSVETDIDDRYSAESAADSYDFIVNYRLKNGRTASRRFRLPETVDPELIDRVIGSPEYKEVLFDLNCYPFRKGRGEGTELCYISPSAARSVPVNEEVLREFKEVYQKDLALYNYSFAHSHFRVGSVQINGSQRMEDAYESWLSHGYTTEGSFEKFQKVHDYISNYSVQYPIYREYTNTIAFLKEKAIWSEMIPEESRVEGIELNYRIVYQDQYFLERVLKLLEKAVPEDSIRGDFHTVNQLDDMTIGLRLKELESDPDRGSSGGSARYLFLKDQTPEEIRNLEEWIPMPYEEDGKESETPAS